MQYRCRVIGLIVGTTLLVSVGADGQRLTLQDLLSAAPMGRTVLSPDGTMLAISRGGQIALMPATGG
jgi:hypothetical protein